MSEPVVLRLAHAGESDAVLHIDDEASALYAEARRLVAFEPTHPFVQAERSRWLAAARSGRMYFALATGGEAVGFMVLDTLDGLTFNRPYYERAGFVTAADAQCGPELREVLRVQKLFLPEPAQRIAMVREVRRVGRADTHG